MAEMRARMGNWGSKLLAGLRRHVKDIVYYGGVMLVLTVIAYAGEKNRSDELPQSASPALPAMELTAPTEEGEDTVLFAPEGAELLRAYAAEPEWNSVLGLWENHEAVDYRMDGGAVASLSAGAVRTVGKSGAYGGFVEVECGEYLLRYASIEPEAGLEPGDKLKPGDSIGTADASMPGEAELGAHLHLELFRGEEAEDFASVCETA